MQLLKVLPGWLKCSIRFFCGRDQACDALLLIKEFIGVNKRDLAFRQGRTGWRGWLCSRLRLRENWRDGNGREKRECGYQTIDLSHHFFFLLHQQAH